MSQAPQLQVQRFPLRGSQLIEASAGTGKTYALSALAVRFVAEFDTPAAALCIVSFTEAATAELRGRVRARLVEVADALERGTEPGDDLVVAAVARVDHPDELARRIARLRTAVAEFDAATITTIMTITTAEIGRKFESCSKNRS